MDEDDSGASSSGSVPVKNIVENTGIRIKNTSYGNSSRTARNLAEKQRRDIINGHIAKMASLVPMIANSSRKMDKISILRLTGAHLRSRYTLGDRSNSIRPPMLSPEFDLEQFLLNSVVDGKNFFFVVTTAGKIVYISRQAEQYIGDQIDLLGQSMYDYVHPNDRNDLMRNLTPEGMQPMSAPSPRSITSELTHDNNSNSSEDSSTTNSRKNEGIKNFQEQRRYFTIRIAQRLKNTRNPKRDDPPTRYECFDISGLFKLAEACKNMDLKGRERRSTSNDIIFAAVATPSRKRPITQLSILNATKDEYMTRHLVDGRIIYCDHRVSFVAGYLSEEVSGLNAFAFMHKDDFRWTMIGLRQMYDHGEAFGSSCYRLLTKTNDFIYLRTAGYLEFDEKTQTVESLLCVNTLVSEEEGIRLIKEMKERFSATLSSTSRNLIRPVDINASIELPQNSQSPDEPEGCRSLTEEPEQLEKAVNHLISNLPSPISEDSFSLSPHLRYCLSPIAAQANKIGVDKIDRCTITQDKGKVTQKQKPKHTIGKSINSNNTEQSPISDSESATGKPLSMMEMNAAQNNHCNVQNTDVLSVSVPVQSKILVDQKPGTSSCAPHNHTSCLDVSQNVNVLNAQESMDQCNVDMLSPGALNESTTPNIKMERSIVIEETFNCPEKQEPMLQYFDDNPSSSGGNSIVSSGIEMHDRCPLKRIRSDENLTMYNKKKSNDVYASTNTNNEQQHASYLKCKSFTTEYPTSTFSFNQYNDVNSQSMTIVESHEVKIDYQQLVDPVVPLATNHDKEFIELQDMTGDTLLSSELDANPEIMRKILDSLCNGSTSFENVNELNLQQVTPNDPMINNELNHTHYELADNMALRESKINVLVHDLQTPAFHGQREVSCSFSQIQAEHNRQKQILKTLQKDHKIYTHKVRVKKLGI